MSRATKSSENGGGGRRSALWLTILFTVLTVLFTYPISTSPGTYLNELADTRLVAWALAWNAHALITDPLHIFDANIFFPHQGTLAYSEPFVGPGVMVAPVNWAGSPVLAYNLVLLSSFVLSGVGAALWVRHMTGSTGAGLLAGIVWAFAPSKFDHLPHLHMLVGQWIPFALLFCSRYIEKGRARDLWATAALAGLQFTFSMHFGLYLLVALVLYAAALSLSLPAAAVRSNPLQRIKQLAFAAIVYAAVTLPIALPYTQLNEGSGPERPYGELVSLSAKPRSFISASAANRTAHMRASFEHYRAPEANYSIGIAVALLAALALFVLLPRAAWRLADRTHEISTAALDGGARDPPRGRFAPWLFRGAVILAVAAATLHFGGFLAARAVRLGRDGGWAQAVVDLCRALDPAIWLALAASAMIVSMPWRWRRRLAPDTVEASSSIDAGEQSSDDEDEEPPETARAAAYLVVVGYVTLMFYLLAFGPAVHGWGAELGRGPYWLLYEWVLPFRGIRAVGRIGMLWVLFAGALAGFSMSWVQARLTSRRRVGGALLLLVATVVVWEYRTWPLPHAEADPGVDPVYDWLAGQSGDFAVVHVPLQPGNRPSRETRYMLGSTRHWKRLVNGYSGFFPDDYGELVAEAPLTPAFFRLLRSDFPVRYMLVHDDWLANDQQHARLRRLLGSNGDAVLVDQVGYTYVFEVPRDRETGTYARRRFTGDQLRGKSGIQFLVRTRGEAGQDVVLSAGWGTGREIIEVDTEWRGARVEIPPGYLDALDGGPGEFEVRVHRLVPLGGTGALIASGFTADVQERGAGIGLEATWFHRTDGAPGLQVHTLERYGTGVSATEEFPATTAGATAFHDHLGSLADGTVVAVTMRTGVRRRLDAAEIEGIRMIGGDPSTADPVLQLALVGRKGASPGQALLHVHHKWAFVDIEVPLPTIEITGLGLY